MSSGWSNRFEDNFGDDDALDDDFALPDLASDSVDESAVKPPLRNEGVRLYEDYASSDEEWGVDVRPTPAHDGVAGERFGVAPDRDDTEFLRKEKEREQFIRDAMRSDARAVLEDDGSEDFEILPDVDEDALVSEADDDGLDALFGGGGDDDGVFETVDEETDDAVDKFLNARDDDDDSADEDSAFSDGTVFRLSGEDLDAMRDFDIDAIIDDAIQRGASDIDIQPNKVPWFSINGDWIPASGYKEIPGDVTVLLQRLVTSNVGNDELVESRELDASYTVKTGRSRGRRVRVSAGFSFFEVFFTMRVISDVIPTPEQIGVPDRLLQWVEFPSGLFLVNGSTGMGKSTTLAAMIRYLQLRQPRKILTIEKPVEYVYPKDGRGLIVQREVPTDARTFEAALTSGLRQNPNVILTGEARNAEEIDQLLRSAETGHLAISTMHTKSAPATVSRIASTFRDDREKVMNSLAAVARGFMNQVLIKKLTRPGEKEGRVAVREILEVDEEVRALIRAEDIDGLEQYQMDHEISMEHELVRAVRDGLVDAAEARGVANKPEIFDKLLGR